jgi:hypothetical protein
MKKYLVYENDDDLEILLEADTLEEMAKKLLDLFKDGYCDTYLVTREVYEKRRSEVE